MEYPRFDTATVLFGNKIFENLNIEKAKLGKNTFSMIIDKTGKIKNFKPIFVTDKKIFRQLKKMVFSKDFDLWKPADYYGTIVNYDLRFSIILDDDFSKYDLKNKWSQETNEEEFERHKKSTPSIE